MLITSGGSPAGLPDADASRVPRLHGAWEQLLRVLLVLVELQRLGEDVELAARRTSARDAGHGGTRGAAWEARLLPAHATEAAEHDLLDVMQPQQISLVKDDCDAAASVHSGAVSKQR